MAKPAAAAGAGATSGRAGVSGNKFRMALGLPVGAVINCADNTGAWGGGALPPPASRRRRRWAAGRAALLCGLAG